MTTTTDRLRALERSLDRAQGQKEALEQQREDSKAMREHDQRRITTLEAAAELVQAATETRRQELKDRVESLVTRGLRAVFGRNDYEFAFDVSLSRSMIGVVPVLRSEFEGDMIETAITEGHGGGIADVVSFVLRVVVLSLTRPRLAPVMVLDESFRHVSPDCLRGVATLLRELNQSAGIQFILVTHKPELLDAADVIYRAELKRGRTVFHLEHHLRDDAYHQAPRRTDTAAPRSAFTEDDLTETEPEAEPSEASGKAGIEQRRNRTKRLIKRKKKGK